MGLLGVLINCGSTSDLTLASVHYTADINFATTGTAVTLPNSTTLHPPLSTLCHFPSPTPKPCYVIPTLKSHLYLIRTTFYYGTFDGGDVPPLFERWVEGTRWSRVDTREDHGKGLAGYYEVTMRARGRSVEVCFVGGGFLNVVEVLSLGEGNGLYGVVDLGKVALGGVGRSFLGGVKEMIRGKTLEIQTPLGSLPASNYYIVLYFQDNRNPSPYSWRVFNVSINGQLFYSKLNVTAKGVSVYSTEWPLSGQTKIALPPEEGIPTQTRDVMAMEALAKSLDNRPADWHGDSCLPQQYTWTGVSCSESKMSARVATLNVTGMGLSGSLPSSVGNLTARHHLWLGDNKLSCHIPDLSSLMLLETLHMENNQLDGSIPESLGKLRIIKQIYLRNNRLDGKGSRELEEPAGFEHPAISRKQSCPMTEL
ncbi:putative LRR receptor-like serine/threonine-protein kinase [Drosera capensis]